MFSRKTMTQSKLNIESLEIAMGDKVKLQTPFTCLVEKP
jgi:hypothetical protein